MKNSKKHHSPGMKLTCMPKRLPKAMQVQAAKIAREVNPVNHAPVEHLAGVMRGFRPSPLSIALVTSKYWGTMGVKLGVKFLDSPEKALRRRILEHMNAWNATANVKFGESVDGAEVRIARMDGDDGGYWSYLGTDILSIAPDEPTLNLEAFTMDTPESEFVRVVRHEAGHTLGFPHEHMRRALVNRIDTAKAIKYFGLTQGWSPAEVRAQVLTPLEEGSLMATPEPDPDSIMCYQIPGLITKNGEPILGGDDISELDYEFVAQFYPQPKAKTRTLPAAESFHRSVRRAARPRGTKA